MPRIAEETIDDREEATIDDFIAFLKATSLKRNPTGTIPRFNQGRASGCVHASFVVPEGLAPEHRVGLFAKPATYAAWIRFANASSDTDRDADVRGMSIKVLDVPGRNLTAGATSQDFILNSHPVMVVPNTAEFLDLFRAMDAGGLDVAGYFLRHPHAARDRRAGPAASELSPRYRVLEHDAVSAGAGTRGQVHRASDVSNEEQAAVPPHRYVPP